MRRFETTGMVIVELAIGLAIVTLSFGGLFVMLDCSTRIMENNRRELEATLAAESTLESVRAASWMDITNKPEQYTLDARTAPSLQPGMTATVAIVAWNDAALRLVTVSVPWHERNGHSRASALCTILGPWGREP